MSERNQLLDYDVGSRSSDSNSLHEDGLHVLRIRQTILAFNYQVIVSRVDRSLCEIEGAPIDE
jgi:hypothetical protein